MMQKDFKIIIIGFGSIGQRHYQNLLKLGYKNVYVYDINKKKIAKKTKTINKLNPKELRTFRAALICTPPSSHIDIALKIAEERIAIFIEKPLSSNLKNIQVLTNKVKKYRIPVMLGYNLNFHPQFLEIQKILKNNTLGQIWGVRAEFGHYLPDWHPQEDYRQGYNAQKRLGGGIILDDIHEIDYLYKLFGPVKKVFVFAEKVSNLEIETEDYAEIVLWFKNGIIGQVHMDYLQREYSRNLKIIGEKGTVTWDLKKNQLNRSQLKNFDFNQTYLEEIKHFLDCLQNKKNPQPDLKRGSQTLKTALAIKKSAKLQKVVDL